MPHPQTRIRTRRFTPCYRHPSEPVTGFCALCLRDRLACLESSISGSGEVEETTVCSRRTRGHGVAPAPELRRSKSVAADKCKVVDGDVIDQRRKSCDVRARSSLSDLFVIESMKLGFQDIDEEKQVRVLDQCNEDSRVSDECDDEIRVLNEGEKRPMKEMIEIEFRNKRNNFWEAASVFNQKLRKWREKHKGKKECRSKLGQLEQFRDNQCQSEVTDYVLGRRSCDTEPRFSIDANRLSVDDQLFTFDEHRASCDGYMIGRTIPRLTPMLSNSVKSSSTKTVGFGGGEEGKSGSNARVSPANDLIFQGTKLVITEKELKDWNSNSVNTENIDSNSNAAVFSNNASETSSSSSNGHKKAISSRLRKVCNLWGGHKHKLDDKKNVESVPENKFDKGNSRSKLVRNASTVYSRNRSDQICRDFVLDRNRSTRYSTSDVDSGLLKLYLTPFRNPRRSKLVKNRGPFMVSNGFQLN